MREILFRGKTNYEGIDSEWLYGSLLAESQNTFPIIARDYDNDEDWIGVNGWGTVDPETVGQFTGLTDKNGEKIFEGDIVRFREWSNGDMCWVGKVHYEHQQFVVSGDKNKECETPFTLVMSRFIPENIEVIGNIHDNPKLLNN